MLHQAHINVIGDVTRVGFRAHMRIQARTCSVTGWARNVYNHPDIFGPHGGVEMVVQGDEIDVKRMLEHIRDGSTISRIDDVEIRFEEPSEIFADFTILKSEAFSHHE